jgi:hypothetical protein
MSLYVLVDENSNCPTFFKSGKILHGDIPSDIKRTWALNSLFANQKNVEYAQLFCQGESLTSVCPEKIKANFLILRKRMAAYQRSFRTCKIDTKEVCLYDLVPEDFVLEYSATKYSIVQSVFRNFEKPENHDFLVETARVFDKIAKRELNLDFAESIKIISDSKSLKFFRRLKSRKNVIYDIFGTKTGRVRTKRNSFGILGFDKAYRRVLKPNNDFFLELDFNGAELRVLLSLQGKEQPSGDIHDWNAEHIFQNASREDSKKQFWSWFYNPDFYDEKLDSVYDRKLLTELYFKGGKVKNPYGRIVSCDIKHANNYLLQNTSSDTVLDRMVKIDQFLTQRKSKSEIAFLMADSLIFDMSNEDIESIPELVKLFENTKIGWMLSNLYVGTSYGSMKRMKLREFRETC